MDFILSLAYNAKNKKKTDLVKLYFDSMYSIYENFK